MKISISDFTFQFAGHGHYKVIYQSPKTSKKWAHTTDDMQLMDATKNEEKPKIKDLQILKRMCKNH